MCGNTSVRNAAALVEYLVGELQLAWQVQEFKTDSELGVCQSAASTFLNSASLALAWSGVSEQSSRSSAVPIR